MSSRRYDDEGAAAIEIVPSSSPTTTRLVSSPNTSTHHTPTVKQLPSSSSSRLQQPPPQSNINNKLQTLQDLLFTPKLLVLLLLTLQVAGSVMIGRVVMSRGNADSQTSSRSPKEQMQPTVLVMWTEWVKIVGCGLWLWISDPSPKVEEQMRKVCRSNNNISSGGGDYINDDDGAVCRNMNINIEEGGGGDGTRHEEVDGVVAVPPPPPHLYIITHPISTFLPQLHHIQGQVLSKSMQRVFFPAVLFTIQANVIYVALRHLDVTAFQVLHQLKLPLTAILSAIIVGVKVSKIQWVALFVTFVGILIAQLKPPSGKAAGGGNPSMGLVAVLLCVGCSATSAVLMELILKQDDAQKLNINNNNNNTSSVKGGTKKVETVSVSVRNVQLALYLFSFTFLVHFGGAWLNGEGTAQYRIGAGFTTMITGLDFAAWSLIMIQAAGGVIVSLVLIYANNILKGCAIGCSVVVVGALNWAVFGVIPSLLFTLGASTVMAGVIAYSVVSAWK